LILIETVLSKNTGFEEQNLWGWMELLIVPLLIPISVLWLTRRTQENERSIANYNARKAELQNYFDRMTDLLLKHNLLSSSEYSEKRTIARTLTLSVIPELNAYQKSQVLIFLYDARLIYGYEPVLRLEKIDLRYINIPARTNLPGVSMREANLWECNFERVNIYRADLRGAQLQNGNFIDAILKEVSLRGAELASADLKRASLVDADLRFANLRDANLEEADLEDANLSNSDLRGAIFRNAVLINTKLRDAIVSKEQLKTAQLLRNVTMPNGTIIS
jgi:uncharacterized protein YjbI with pentapeptide repeats